MTKEKKEKNEGGEVMKKESKRTKKKTFHKHSARIYLMKEKNQATNVGNFRERKPVLQPHLFTASMCEYKIDI